MEDEGNFSSCPRCGDNFYERLRTHSFCAACNYSPLYEADEITVPEWAMRLPLGFVPVFN